MTDRITQMDATGIAELIARREISPVEVVQAHLDRIAAVNPKLNAIVALADGALEAARKAEAVVRAGAPLGPLHGVPFTTKDAIDTAGVLTQRGSPIFKGRIADTDATVVARLKAAGGILIAKTNTPEFSYSVETDNLLTGRTNNPWNLDYTPGGSSGGESAAIAAGLSAAGLGSDSGGSVRVPAHFTGICSLKPTPGRIPGRGHLPPCVGPFSVLGAIGPMARTMQDVSLLFRTLSGQDPDDPASPPLLLQNPSLGDLREHTIGFFEDDGLSPVTPETRTAVRNAAQALQNAGFRVEPFRPRTLEQLRKLWWTFFVQCGAMFYEPAIRGRHAQLSPIFSEFLSIADSVPPLSSTDLLNAWAELDLLRSKTLEVMRDYPVLLCPVAGIPAFRHGERAWCIEGQTVKYLDVMRSTQWFNTLAAPAAVVPAGRSPEGLPIGVQIIARPFEDEIALGIASVLDAEFGYQPPSLARGQ